MTGSAQEFPIWRTPIVLAALTVFGLLDALLVGSAIARAVAWAALVVPLLVAIRCVLGAWKKTDARNGRGLDRQEETCGRT